VSVVTKGNGEGRERKLDPYWIPHDGFWASAWRYAAVLGVLGMVVCGVTYGSDPHRFAFSWLFAFFATLTLGLGALFLVIVLHLTGAGWGVTLRRQAEFFASGIFVMAILFVPIWLHRHDLYEWTHGGHGDAAEHADLLGGTAQAQERPPAPPSADPAPAAHGAGEGDATHAGAALSRAEEELHHRLMEHKSVFLSSRGLLIRAAFYFAVWILLAFLFFSESTRQDETKDPKHTVDLKRYSPLAMIALAFTLTFAAFDWVMALQPTWFSTIFGVYVFAGAAVSIFAIVIVISLALKADGLLGEAVTAEHLHDAGKLMFGFVVFWAYIGFSQMMLQWYANLPEEVAYYHLRWQPGGWRNVSLFLIFGHFVVPFLFLLSRNIKRRVLLLGIGAAWMLVVHFVDIYWFVMPYASDGFEVRLVDLGAVFAVLGTYLAVVFYRMRNHALIPVGDPRLSRAMTHAT